VSRGGRRKGAGAPRGNVNRVKTGSSTDNGMLAMQVQALAPGPQREFWLRVAREAGGAPVREVADTMLAELKAEVDQSNVTRIDEARIGRAPAAPRARVNYTHTHTDTQSNNNQTEDLSKRRQTLVERLSRQPVGMFRAESWVDRHWPSLDVIEDLTDEIIRRYESGEMMGVTNLAGLLKDQLHEEIALKSPRLWHCPHCKWSQLRFAGMEEQTS